MTNDLFLAILAMDAYNRTGGDSTRGLVLIPSSEIGLLSGGRSVGARSLAQIVAEKLSAASALFSN